jgi:hypothetical protein
LRIGFIGGEKRPIISFEVKPWKDEDPGFISQTPKRTLDEAWAQA